MSLIRPIASRLAQPLARALTEVRGGGFNPARLFAGGAKGVLYDFTDAATLFQDSAGTTAIAAGQGIGLVRDKSGNGIHATQSTGASKPLWQTTYSAYDGFDDFLVTPSIDFTGTDKVTVVAGLYKASDAAIAVVVELSASASGNDGAFVLFGPRNAGVGNYNVGTRGAAVFTSQTYTTYAAPVAQVISARLDLAGAANSDEIIARINGATPATAALDGANAGTGNYGNHPLYIGRRAGSSLPFNGRIHRLLIIGRALTASELAQAERWAAQPTGVTL